MNNRRQFIRRSLAGSAAISMSGALPSFLVGASRKTEAQRGNKILVVIQLSGGNDGLNTVVPYGDDEYYKNRFTLAVGKNTVLKVDDHVGLHPSLGGFKQLVEDGKLAIVQGVGYKNPNRSHFESMDLWHTAHRLEEGRVGWLGRTVDQGAFDDQLPALHLGGEVQPLALRNTTTPVPSIRSIDNFRLNALRDRSTRKLLEPLLAAARPKKNELLSYIHESANVALTTSSKLESISKVRDGKFGYPGSNLGRNMRAIAQLIGSGLSTQIYYTSLGGFDTHSNQGQAHAGLLTDLDNSVSAFMKELRDQGNEDRVALFSFSEFGRRVRENASRGTDHGTAAPVFVIGSKVKPGLIGKHPELGNLDEGDLRYSVDYRQVYAALLRDWLEVEPAPIVGAEYGAVSIFA